MSENKALWNRVCVTDPKAVKEITGKQYKGNSPKPYWIVERLTEEFGPCGLGWGFSIVSERMERLSEHDVLHIAVVDFWYVFNRIAGDPCPPPSAAHVQQIGQTKATYLSSAGKLIVDEDAPKKSVTDALVKCASYIGFAGDIFAGRWDDSKYVQQANAHYREKEAADDPERDAVVQALRDCAMVGSEALGREFKAQQDKAVAAGRKPWFAALWKEHSAALKDAAAKADADPPAP